MNFEKGTMLELDGVECCVLEEKEVNKISYLYVAEVADDDITGNFYLYKINDKVFEKVVNSDELKAVLPAFVESMTEELERN